MRAVPAGEHTELVGAYLAEKTGVTFERGLYTAMAVINDNGRFVGGVVFSEYRGHDVQISCASETSMAWRPAVCRAVFDYVFNQLGCSRCTSFTRKSNKRTRDFLDALGFQLEGNMRLGYDGIKDALIYGLLLSECRYLGESSDGQVNPESADAPGPGSNGSGSGPDEQRDGDSPSQPQPDQPVHAGGLFSF